MDKLKDLNSSFDSDSLNDNLQREKLCASERKKRIYKRKQCLLKQTEPEMVPPDGGWGWAIIVGGFITMVCGAFPIFGFSILFSPLLKSGVSSSKIAWIISIQGLVWNCAALFVGPLSAEFGWRNLAMVGGVLNFLSVFLSAFVTNPDLLFFSFAVLGGVGGSTGLSLCFIVVSRYFLRHRGFALAATSLGVCVCAFVSPIIANYLLEHYGYRGATLIYGAIVLNQCVGGAFFQPVEWHMKPIWSPDSESENNINKEKLLQKKSDQENLKYQVKRKLSHSLPQNKLLSLSQQDNKSLSAYSLCSTVSLGASLMDIETLDATSQDQETIERSKKMHIILKRILMSTYKSILTLKFKRVQIICIAAGCLSLGYVNFQMWVPFVIRNAGYSREMSAWCISSSSIANIIGRVTMSFLSDRKWFSIKIGYMFSMFLLGISIIGFSFVQEITWFLVFVCCWGLGIGIAYSLNATVFIETMGIEIFPSVFGVSSLFVAIFSIVFGPIVGIIRDATSSYTFALGFLGVAELIGFGAWIFMPFATKYDENVSIKKKLKAIEEIT